MDHNDDGDGMRGALRDAKAVRLFIEAGNATITIKSLKTGGRFTFKFVRPDQEPGRMRPIWVRLLNGPDNEANYVFAGTIFPDDKARLVISMKSKVAFDAPSMKALVWFLQHLYYKDGEGYRECVKLFEQAEIWHEGRCGRCGRKLTVPSSIATGFGPDCAGVVAHEWRPDLAAA